MGLKVPSAAVEETICLFQACPLRSQRSSPAPRQVRNRGSWDLLVSQNEGCVSVVLSDTILVAGTEFRLAVVVTVAVRVNGKELTRRIVG